MAGVFGNHQLGIPYQPIAELFAQYRARDAGKTAIVDLDEDSSITFGELDQLTTDIAAFLKSKGVKKGGRVQITGFGTFESRKRAARKGRNPKTGEVIKIKASKSPAFKAGKSFKDAL